jgi:hypothetical protein
MLADLIPFILNVSILLISMSSDFFVRRPHALFTDVSDLEPFGATFLEEVITYNFLVIQIEEFTLVVRILMSNIFVSFLNGVGVKTEVLYNFSPVSSMFLFAILSFLNDVEVTELFFNVSDFLGVNH